MIEKKIYIPSLTTQFFQNLNMLVRVAESIYNVSNVQLILNMFLVNFFNALEKLIRVQRDRKNHNSVKNEKEKVFFEILMRNQVHLHPHSWLC